MGVLRDGIEVLGATGLALVGYALPLGLGLVRLLGPVAPTVEPADVDPPAVVARLEPVARPAPITILVEAPRPPVLAPADPTPDATLAMIASPRASRSPVEPPSARPPEAPPAPPVVEEAPSEPRGCEPRTTDIVREGASSWFVDRSLIGWYASRPGRLDALGWVAKHEGPDGKVQGFRLGGIRCGSELHLAGLRNGDVVHTVNGYRVRNIAEGFLLYARLRKADVVELEVERKGRIERLTYRLG